MKKKSKGEKKEAKEKPDLNGLAIWVSLILELMQLLQEVIS